MSLNVELEQIFDRNSSKY